MNNSQFEVRKLLATLRETEPLADLTDAFLFTGAELLNELRQAGLPGKNVATILGVIDKIANGAVTRNKD